MPTWIDQPLTAPQMNSIKQLIAKCVLCAPLIFPCLALSQTPPITTSGACSPVFAYSSVAKSVTLNCNPEGGNLDEVQKRLERIQKEHNYSDRQMRELVAQANKNVATSIGKIGLDIAEIRKSLDALLDQRERARQPPSQVPAQTPTQAPRYALQVCPLSVISNSESYYAIGFGNAVVSGWYKSSQCRNVEFDLDAAYFYEVTCTHNQCVTFPRYQGSDAHSFVICVDGATQFGYNNLISFSTGFQPKACSGQSIYVPFIPVKTSQQHRDLYTIKVDMIKIN